MKYLSKFFGLSLIVAMTMLVTSCGGDDADGDEPGSGGSNSDMEISDKNLVGMWRYDWGNDPESDYTAYYFAGKDEYGDCSGVFFDKGNGGERFEYTFDRNKRMMEIEYEEGGYETLSISDLKSNSVMIDGDMYVKSELTKEMILLGEWLLHVDVSSSDILTRVKFYSDGTYAAVDNLDYSDVTELNCSFEASILKKIYGSYYMTGNKISFTGKTSIAGDYIIDGLVINGMRLVRASHPGEYPWIIGGWNNR